MKSHRPDEIILNGILDSIPGLLFINDEGIITYVNRQMEEYKGRTYDEMVGEHITKFFPYTKMVDTLLNGYDERVVLYQGEESTSKEFCEASVHRLIRKDGKVLGCVTYDMFQDLEGLEQFISMYTSLDDRIKYADEKSRKYRTTKYSINDIIGVSGVIVQMKEKIQRAAKSNSIVLIEGETGSGKELVAHSIHNLSKRFMNPFVEMNISGVPETLLEAELFGYEPGAFTGASKSGKIGKFEQANRGTLFIDEIETMSMATQPKLLRALQEKEIERLGGNQKIHMDVRIIAATNRDLEEMIEKGEFREDLFYRLDVVRIDVPPLRERKVDIPLLAEDFLSKFNQVMETNIQGITPEAMEKLKTYEWPGNVRELRNVIERAMNEKITGYIDDDDISFSGVSAKNASGLADVNKKFMNSTHPIEEAKRYAEKNMILSALKESNGNRTQAAKLLNISRPLLYQKMERLGIK